MRLVWRSALCAEIFLFGRNFMSVVGQAPTLGTGAFTGFTPDAERAVVQDRLWHIQILNSFFNRYFVKCVAKTYRGAYAS